MAKQLIIKNLTALQRQIGDIGVYVPASATINVTELFAKDRFLPANSSELATYIQNDVLQINDGTSDLTKAAASVYLTEFAVETHDIVKHSGTYPESNLQDNNVFARLAQNETITGVWTVDSQGGGQLHVENGATLPTGTPVDGRIFWNTAEQFLYVSEGGTWHNITYTQSAFYQSPLVYEFGSYSTFSSGYLNTQWAVSSTSPVIVPRNGTIKSLSCDAGNSGTVSAYKFTIRRKSGSSWVDFVSVTKSDGSGYIISTGLSVDFSTGDQFACYAQVTSGFGSLTNPHLYLEVIWRE